MLAAEQRFVWEPVRVRHVVCTCIMKRQWLRARLQCCSLDWWRRLVVHRAGFLYCAGRLKAGKGTRWEVQVQERVGWHGCKADPEWHSLLCVQ